jgi:hypothetical protein
VAACLQVIVVACSLGFILCQLRQQRLQLAQQTLQLDQQVKLSRAANTQTLVDLITPLNLRVTYREIAELWVKGDDGIDSVVSVKEREIQREQYSTLVASYMVFYENAYSQYRAGLLDEEIYKGWDKDLASFLEEHHIAKHWDEWKDLYRKDFSDHVSQIIATQESTHPKQPSPN